MGDLLIARSGSENEPDEDEGTGTLCTSLASLLGVVKRDATGEDASTEGERTSTLGGSFLTGGLDILALAPGLTFAGLE